MESSKSQVSSQPRCNLFRDLVPLLFCAIIAGASPAAGQCPTCVGAACSIGPATLDSSCTLLNFPAADVTVVGALTVPPAVFGQVLTINAKSLTLQSGIDLPRGALAIRVADSFTSNTAGQIDVSAGGGHPSRGSVTIGPLTPGDTPTITIGGAINANGGGPIGGTRDAGTITIADVSSIDVQANLTAAVNGVDGTGGTIDLIDARSVTISALIDTHGFGSGNGGDITVRSRGDVTVAGNLTATSQGANTDGGNVVIAAGASGSISVSGTVDVTSTTGTGDENGTITVGPACNVTVSGTLDAQHTGNTGGEVKVLYRGTFGVPTGTIRADSGGMSYECRCANITHDGLCGSSPACETMPTIGDTDPLTPAPAINPPFVGLPVAIAACQSEAVLLIDASGSMDWAPDGTFSVPVPQRRITLVKASARLFVDMLDVFSAGDAKVGVAEFPAHPFAECVGLAKMPLEALSTGQATAHSTVLALTPSGSTPLLGGLDAASAMFTPTGSTTRAIVLLSDGYHNCPTEVAQGSSEVTTAISDANAAKVDLYTIGFGAAADTPLTFLDEIAVGTGGRFKDVTADPGFNPATFSPVTALQDAYMKILTDTFDLDASADPLGIIAGGATVTEDFNVNAYDERVAVVLGWQSESSRRLGLQVISSDGHPVRKEDPGVRWIDGDTYKIVSVGPAFLRQAGKVGSTPWRIGIDAANVPAGSEERYQYSVIVDSSLKMHTGVGPVVARTGSVLTLTAKLTQSGQPVTGLSNVSVRVTRPEDGLGNWLFANPVVLPPSPPAPGIDSPSATARRAAMLTEQGVAWPRRTSPERISLFDDGSHGDVAAGDGVYTNQYTDTRHEGTYAFWFEVSGDHGGVHFEREDIVHRHVPLALDTAKSVLQVTRVNDSRLLVTVEPRDVHGNHLGPDRAAGLILVPSVGKMTGVIEDKGNGRYTQTVDVPSGTDIDEVKIEVRQPGILPLQPPEKKECGCWCRIKRFFGCD